MPGQTVCRTQTPPPKRYGFNGGPSNCPAKQGRAGRRCRPRSCFNGGPSNCPAKRPPFRAGNEQQHAASMEGRAIARPNRFPADTLGVLAAASMEGRAIARPNLTSSRLTPAPRAWLQWRAEQLPGQTLDGRRRAVRSCLLQWRAEQLPGQTAQAGARAVIAAVASMEGRAIARPNRHALPDGEHVVIASMEGRAIARPNTLPSVTEIVSPSGFNGGPSNCPAKQAVAEGGLHDWRVASMEGRAIARPNYEYWGGGVPEAEFASMEGRAIARPNMPP